MQSPRHTIARLGPVTSTAALAYFGSVTRTLCPRRCVAVEARTSVGYTLGFVLAYAPSRVAPRHVACDAVARGMGINGVPFFEINNKTYISGAQSNANLIEAIRANL